PPSPCTKQATTRPPWTKRNERRRAIPGAGGRLPARHGRTARDPRDGLRARTARARRTGTRRAGPVVRARHRAHAVGRSHRYRTAGAPGRRTAGADRTHGGAGPLAWAWCRRGAAADPGPAGTGTRLVRDRAQRPDRRPGLLPAAWFRPPRATLP